jgi:hypothetical protein
MSYVKKQHYVPQFYLRQFTKSGENIHVYDKFIQKSFRSGVRDIASNKFFYDLSQEIISEWEGLIQQKQAEESIDQSAIDKLLEQIKDVQLIEKYLSRLESRFSRVLNEVLDGLDKRRRLKHKYRYDLALMAAVQFWRTQERRENMMELERKLEERVMRIVDRMNEVKGTNFTAKDLAVAFDAEETATRHKMMLLKTEILEETAQTFANHIWVIGVNDTNNPLYTSDNPVTTSAHKVEDWRSHTGIASLGVEVIFPLSPKYVLIMYERSYHHLAEYKDGTLSYLKQDNIRYYNSRQVYSSYRQVFSIAENFELVKEMLSKEPELAGPRERWE